MLYNDHIRNMMRNVIQTGTVEGIPPLNLPQSKGKTLKDYKIYGKNKQDILLPIEYQEVEYIESTGTQYINTGYSPSKDDAKIEYYTKFRKTSTSLADNCVGGSSNNDIVQIKLPNLCNNYVEVNSYYKQNYFTRYDNNTDYEYWIIGDSLNVMYKLNDYKMTYTSNQSLSTLLNSNIYLFALNRNNIAKWFFVGRIYRATFKDEGILVRDFIPCYRKSDNEVGMYDLIENKFYTNKGTGTFEKGSDVLPTSDEPFKIKSVGDLVATGEYTGKYKIPVTATNGIDTFTTNIYLNEPLRKIDNYADYIDFKNKKVIRNIALADTDLFIYRQSNDNNSLFAITSARVQPNYLHLKSTITTMCSHCGALPNSASGASAELGKGVHVNVYSATTNNVWYLVLPKNKVGTTVGEFKQWLNGEGQGFEFQYILETPYEEYIELPRILTARGTTILSVGTEITPSNMSVEYIK